MVIRNHKKINNIRRTQSRFLRECIKYDCVPFVNNMYRTINLL